jgi:hypothetical protein
MFSRKELAEAYQCGVDKLRTMLHAIGVLHQGRITPEEFELLQLTYGRPRKPLHDYTPPETVTLRKRQTPMHFGQMTFWG